MFRDFPYLYDGSLDYEESYLEALIESKDSIIVAAEDDGKIVGSATGSALEGHHQEFAAPFLEHGHDPAKVFYCGELSAPAGLPGTGSRPHIFRAAGSSCKGAGLRVQRLLWGDKAGQSPAQTRNLFAARYVLEEARLPESRGDDRHVPLERHRSAARD